VSALAASRVLDDTLYQEPNLAVAGGSGTVAVASCHHLTGLPLDGGEPRWVHPPNGKFVGHWYAAAASHCGQLVAFGGSHWHDDPNLLVLDAADGTVRLALDTRSFGTRAPVRALAFHPDGWLAVGLGDGQVRQVTLGGAIVAYRGIAGSLAALAFTPDGSALLVGGASLQGLRRIELS
jgi:WD40 repeat protein